MRKREVLGKAMKPSPHKSNLRCLKVNFYLIGTGKAGLVLKREFCMEAVLRFTSG